LPLLLLEEKAFLELTELFEYLDIGVVFLHQGLDFSLVLEHLGELSLKVAKVLIGKAMLDLGVSKLVLEAHVALFFFTNHPDILRVLRVGLLLLGLLLI